MRVQDDRARRVPKIAEDEPWDELNRWGIAWRVALSLTGVGLAAVCLSALLAILNGNLPAATMMLAAFTGPWLLVFGLLVSLAFGPWLRRYRWFVQAPLFGAMLAVVIVLVFVLLWGADVIIEPCVPSEYCENRPDLIVAGVFAFAVPPFALATVAYALAIGVTRLLTQY